MKNEYRCPKDNSVLVKKRFASGLSFPEMTDDESVILGGGCAAEDDPKICYECPFCKKVFIIKRGQLSLFSDGEEHEEQSGIEDEGKNTLEKIDNDIEIMEMLDFLDDGM